MKKILIAALVGLSLTLTACGNSLSKVNINNNDSKNLKKYKNAYNICLDYYNTKNTQDRVLQLYEIESKNHPKDTLWAIMLRSLLNGVDINDSNTKMQMEAELKKEMEKIKSKPCCKNEYTNLKKLSNDDIMKRTNFHSKLMLLSLDDNQLKEYLEPYMNLEENICSLFYINGYKDKEVHGEEFLNQKTREKTNELWKEQNKVLIEMKKKLDCIK